MRLPVFLFMKFRVASHTDQHALIDLLTAPAEPEVVAGTDAEVFLLRVFVVERECGITGLVVTANLALPTLVRDQLAFQATAILPRVSGCTPDSRQRATFFLSGKVEELTAIP
jgi:hypothetical protein